MTADVVVAKLSSLPEPLDLEVPPTLWRDSQPLSPRSPERGVDGERHQIRGATRVTFG
jgi:hypothetical protein